MSPSLTPIGNNAIRLLQIHDELSAKWSGVRVTWNMVLSYAFKRLDLIPELEDEIGILEAQIEELENEFGVERDKRVDFSERVAIAALEALKTRPPGAGTAPRMMNIAVAQSGLKPPPPNTPPFIQEMRSQFARMGEGPIMPSQIKTAEFEEPKLLPIDDYESIPS